MNERLIIALPQCAMDITISMYDAYTVYGRIQDKTFIYNYSCDTAPRFIGYKASTGEVQFLKHMIDAYLASDEGREHILSLMFA